MNIPLLPAHLPIFTHHISMLSHSTQPLDDSSLPPAPTCLPCPHFRFFCIIYACFPATTFLPHPPPLYVIVSHTSHLLDDPFDICFDYISYQPSAFLYLATNFHRLIMFLYMSTVDANFFENLHE